MDRHIPIDSLRFLNYTERRNLLKVYRQRGICLAIFQLTLACLYLLVIYFLRDFILMPFTILNKKYSATHTVPLTMGKSKIPIGTLSVTATGGFRGFDEILFELNFGFAMNALRAVLHIVSSILLLWATNEDPPKLRTVKLCNWTLRMNIVFMLYDILVLFILDRKDWKLGIAFVFYRMLFTYQVGKLMIILETFV